MSNKEELAALMASDGDYEKKISLLKKAVVTVTKQKQEIESRQAKLQEELQTTTQHLMELQRENTLLQRKVKTLGGQLQQERSGGGSAFGQNVLKGLSSIMGSSDDRGGAGGRGRGGGGTPQLTLSAEDVERLVTENEQLHREKYTYKMKLEDTQRASSRDVDKLKADVARLQKEVTDLHGALGSVTSRCDRLNADYLMERAVGDFCRHFFVASLRHNRERASVGYGLPVVVELRWPAAPRLQSLPTPSPSSPSSSTNARRILSPQLWLRQQSHRNNSLSSSSAQMPLGVREAVVRSLQNTCGTVKTLLRGISVLIVALRERLPQRERATVSDLECLRNRLSVFLDAHTIKKDRLMYLLDQLESCLTTLLAANTSATEGGGAPCDALTTETLLEAQDEVLLLFLEWVGLLRAQTPLLVESCVSYFSQDNTYVLHVGQNRASSTSPNSPSPAPPTTDRAEFVEEVTRYGYATLASVEGALTAARVLIQRSPVVYGDAPPFPSSFSERDNGADVKPEGEGGENEEDNVSSEGSSSSTPTIMDAFALLALQQFWWEGCSAVRALHASATALNGGVQDLAEACNQSEVRDALLYLSKCLRSLASDSAAAAGASVASSSADSWSEREADSILAVVPAAKIFLGSNRGVSNGLSSQLPPKSPSRAASAPATGSGGFACDSHASAFTPASAEAFEEVLVALAAADRAAVTYHTQMNYLYREMADKEDALLTAAEAVEQMKELLNVERAESEHTRQMMQAQISILSNQLIEMADAAQSRQQLMQQHLERPR